MRTAKAILLYNPLEEEMKRISCANSKMLSKTIAAYLATVAVLALSAIPIAEQTVPFLRKERVHLRCLHDGMLLQMDLQDIPQIKSTTLHLRHVKCKPQHVTETSVIFRVPFHGCGTVRGATLENMTRYITYSNQVKNTPLKLNSSGIRVSYVAKLHYPFSCYYRQKYVVAIQQRTNDHEGSHVNQGIEGPSKTLVDSLAQNKVQSDGQMARITCIVMASVHFLLSISVLE